MNLTDDMKSLRENIDIAQADRTKWVSDNRKDTHEMMNRNIKENKERAKDIEVMLDGFGKERKEMAGVLRRDLETYVTRIRKETKALLAEYRSDIDGAHDAWIGKAVVETKRKRQKKTVEEGGEES